MLLYDRGDPYASGLVFYVPYSRILDPTFFITTYVHIQV